MSNAHTNLAVERGAIGVVGPRAIEDQYGVYEYATIEHTEIRHIPSSHRDRYKGFCARFDPIDPSRLQSATYHPTGLLAIDHIVGNVEEGRMNEWVSLSQGAWLRTVGLV